MTFENAHCDKSIFSRKNPFELLVATGEGQMAEGMLYWDDGDSLGEAGSEII